MRIDKSFFTKNRQKLIESLTGEVVVMSGHTLMQSSNDAAYVFVQEANFWYLTGINEPNWQVIIDGFRMKSWLVAPNVEPVHQIFEGSLLPQDAMKLSGIDTVIDQNEAQTLLRNLAQKHSIVYTLKDHPSKKYFNFIENPAPKQLVDILERNFNSVQDCRKHLTKLRAIKQPGEIAAIEKAIKLTASAFEVVKTKLSTFHYEYEIEAEFDHHFKKRGATHAYTPIVASGKNACTLHYIKNEGSVNARQLVLIDIGARASGYAADITRTYIKGVATKRQSAVHAAVERAHQATIRLLEPDLSVEAYQKSVATIMKNALSELSLLKGDEETALRRYFPHAVSHGLGIDVHDSLGAPRVFQPNMVLTVEPGIYIPEEGIGVRIEDDILITDSGHKNLSRILSTGL